MTASMAIGEGMGIWSSSSALISWGRIEEAGEVELEDERKDDNLMIDMNIVPTGDGYVY